MKIRMKKGIGGMLLALIMITSIAAVTIPMVAGSAHDTYCISGYKHATADLVEGWTIYIDKNSNGQFDPGEPNTTTVSKGFWKICNLTSSGDPYNVTEVLQDGWTQIEPEGGIHSVELWGHNVIDINFTNEREYANPGTGTPGYWKNHPEAWPVENITIGGVNYTKEQAIANMSKPEKGDKTYTMFRALVAAKLNVLIGNDDSCIDDTIDAADAWMNSYGPVGSDVKAGGKTSPWRIGEPLYTELDAYNNGLLCAPHRD